MKREFPDFVPNAVRQEIADRLDGTSDNPVGWVAILEKIDERLQNLESQLKEAKASNSDLLPSLRMDIKKEKASKARFSDDINCLERLASDERMREVFSLLDFTGQQWVHFITCAWAASVNYGDFRERVDKAKKLKKEIASAAVNLAGLIDKYADNGIMGPGEFWSIPELLRTTDHPEESRVIWSSLRNIVLGDMPDAGECVEPMEPNENKAEHTWVIKAVSPGEKVNINPADQMRNALFYAWEKCPPLPALLMRVADAATDFDPIEDGISYEHIQAALKSRQSSITREYVRAFASLLIREKIAILPAVEMAMACTATVVINSLDSEVSYDNVKKALR